MNSGVEGIPAIHGREEVNCTKGCISRLPEWVVDRGSTDLRQLLLDAGRSHTCQRARSA